MPEEFNNESETGVVYTDQQWESIKRIKEAVSIPQPGEDNQDEELTNELMHLLQLVLMQDTSRIPLYNSPFMHYLAVRGIDVHTKGFRSSFFYTPILAGALWISRLVLLEIAIPLVAWPGLKSKCEVESVRIRIHQIRSKHLCEGSFSRCPAF